MSIQNGVCGGLGGSVPFRVGVVFKIEQDTVKELVVLVQLFKQENVINITVENGVVGRNGHPVMLLVGGESGQDTVFV